MNKQRTQGFTLPQLLVATAIGSILLVSVGMLVNTSLNAQATSTSMTTAKTAIRRINENIANTVGSRSFGVMEKLNAKAAMMVFLNQSGAYSVEDSGSFRNSNSLTLQGTEALNLTSGERVMLINNAGDAVMVNITSVNGRTVTHDCQNTIPFTSNTRLFKTTSYGVALGSTLGSTYNANSLYEMVGGNWSEIAFDVADFSLRTMYHDSASNTIVVDPAVPGSYAGLSPAFVPETPTSTRERVTNVPNVTARSGTEYALYALSLTTSKTGTAGGEPLDRSYGEIVPLKSDSASPVKKLYNCAGGSDLGTDSGGTLYVGVNNAPVPTSVTVNGPAAWSRSVNSTQSFENLQNGTYTGTAPDITYNTYETWRAKWTSNPSSVNSYTGARMIANYEQLPGTLNVQVDGLPAGVNASNSLVLNGPAGTTRTTWNNGANTISDARPGVYTATVGDVQSGLATYKGTAAPASVGLYSGATQTITVTYAVVNGTLDIQYNPNGRGQTVISVSGPNGYSTSITTAGGVNTLSVPPGVYSAVSTYGTGNSPVNVASSNAQTITITAPPVAAPPTGGSGSGGTLASSGPTGSTSSTIDNSTGLSSSGTSPGLTSSTSAGDSSSTSTSGTASASAGVSSSTSASGSSSTSASDSSSASGSSTSSTSGSSSSSSQVVDPGTTGVSDPTTSTSLGQSIAGATDHSDGQTSSVAVARVGSESLDPPPARVCSSVHSTRPVWLNRLLDGLHIRC